MLDQTLDFISERNRGASNPRKPSEGSPEPLAVQWDQAIAIPLSPFLSMTAQKRRRGQCFRRALAEAVG